jgi:hypothetical protein
MSTATTGWAWPLRSRRGFRESECPGWRGAIAADQGRSVDRAAAVTAGRVAASVPYVFGGRAEGTVRHWQALNAVTFWHARWHALAQGTTKALRLAGRQKTLLAIDRMLNKRLRLNEFAFCDRSGRMVKNLPPVWTASKTGGYGGVMPCVLGGRKEGSLPHWEASNSQATKEQPPCLTALRLTFSTMISGPILLERATD